MASTRGRALLRTIGVIAAITGFVALPSRPVHAATTAAVVYTGSFGTGTPIPLACIPGACPTTTFWFGASVCLQGGSNIAEADKSVLNAPFCSISASGTFTGSCMTGGGTGTGSYTDSLGQPYYFTFSMTNATQKIVFTGTITKAWTDNDGVIAGEFFFVPVFTPCYEAPQSNFVMQGTTTVAIPTANAAPGAPTLVAPSSGTYSFGEPATFTVRADDPNLDPYTAHITVRHSDGTTYDIDTLYAASGTDASGSPGTFLPTGSYTWWAYAEDVHGATGPQSATGSFTVSSSFLNVV